MTATAIDLSAIKTDALSAASTFRTLIGLGTSATLNAGSANGVATLGADSKLTAAQIPDISLISYLGSVASQAAMLALTGQQGDWCVRSDLSTTWVITGSDPTLLANWTQLSYPSVPVQSVHGRTGAVVGVSTDYSAVGIDSTAIGASNPSTGAFTTLSTTGRITTPSVLLSGNYSSTAWTTSGVGLSHTARTLTDTSSTGTVATAYTNVLGGNTIAASNATTFTDYASLFIGSPSAGSNVTISNAFSLITQGAARFGGAVGVSAGTLNGTVLDITQTWGGTGTYTGIKYNVTDSGPANPASLLLDLQVGGTSRTAIRKDGNIGIGGYFPSSHITQTAYRGIWFDTSNCGIVGEVANNYKGMNVLANVVRNAVNTWGQQDNSQNSFIMSLGYESNNNGLTLYRAAAGSGNTFNPIFNVTHTGVSIANGTSAQKLYVYNTTDNGSNYERAKIAWSSDVLQIGTEKLGTAAARALELQTDGTTRASIPTTGGLVVGTAALATNATSGFLYVPTCAGTPSGTPASQTGTAPIVIDTTNNKLYFYSGGAWRDAGP